MKPDVIFKYEPCSLQSLRNLKNQVIYFGAPSNFNDPYDCALDPRIKVPEDEDIARLREALLNTEDAPQEIKEELQKINDGDLRTMVLGRSQEILQKHGEQFLNQRGVACFSEINDDLLMWSHYADRYRGFCLGFNTNYDPFKKLERVEYSESMPEIDAVTSMIENEYSQMLKLFLTKSKSWSYEREWRCMHDRAGTEFVYKPEALEAVYFGPAMDLECLEIICLILQGQNRGVRFWKGERDRNDFRLRFTEFSYTRLIDAPQNP